MRVMHITEACGGGVRRHLQLIVPELQRQGTENAVLAITCRAEVDYENDILAFEKCGISAALMRRMGTAWDNLREVTGIVQKQVAIFNPDVLHLHAFWAGLAGRLAKTGVSIVYSPHAFGNAGFFRSACLWGTEKIFGRIVDKYVLVGASELEDARKLGIPAAKLELVQNALPQNFAEDLLSGKAARRQLGISDTEKAVLVPCRPSWQKGIDLLIRAAKHLEDNSVFYVFGDGPQLEQLKSLAAQLAVAGRFRFRGVLSGLWRYARAFDYAVLPSRYEGCSYALLEIMAIGLPLVCSDIPANRIAGEGATYFKSGDVPSLCQALAHPHKPDGNVPSLTLQVAKLRQVYCSLF